MSGTGTTGDGFTRSVSRIDEDLAHQIKRRDEGLAEVMHGCFVAERAIRNIDRLIDERAEQQANETAAMG